MVEMRIGGEERVVCGEFEVHNFFLSLLLLIVFVEKILVFGANEAFWVVLFSVLHDIECDRLGVSLPICSAHSLV